MIIFNMKMIALPEKSIELKQTLLALVEPTRKEKGCLACDGFQDIENQNEFCLIEHWESRKDLEEYQTSDRFAVLVGARSLLDREPEFMVNEVISSQQSNKKM